MLQAEPPRVLLKASSARAVLAARQRVLPEQDLPEVAQGLDSELPEQQAAGSQRVLVSGLPETGLPDSQPVLVPGLPVWLVLLKVQAALVPDSQPVLVQPGGQANRQRLVRVPGPLTLVLVLLAGFQGQR